MTASDSRSADPAWAGLNDEELLTWRICDLKLRLPHTDIQPRIDRLYQELEEKGVHFRPPCYLTREWLVPDKEPTIGIPFALAHPRLRQLEKRMMLEAEGESEKHFMQLIRHEAGHAVNYAYKLYRKSRWRELFGPFSAPYNPHSYAIRPYSRQFVTHLKGNYAQAHPDEDFAETFAVWLTPGLDWRKRYKGWGALPKLEYVDHLMSRIDFSKPVVARGVKHWEARKLRSTLTSYYKWKRKEFAEGYPGYYDPDLKRIFAADPTEGSELASKFFRRNRKTLIQTVCRWTRAPRYTVDSLIRRLNGRVSEIPLHRTRNEADCLMDLTALLTTQVCEDAEEDS